MTWWARSEMGEVQRVGSCSIKLPPVYLGLDDDDKLRKRVFKGLKAYDDDG